MPWSWWCSKGMVAVAACQVATTVREEGDLKGTERGHKPQRERARGRPERERAEPSIHTCRHGSRARQQTPPAASGYIQGRPPPPTPAPKKNRPARGPSGKRADAHLAGSLRGRPPGDLRRPRQPNGLLRFRAPQPSVGRVPLKAYVYKTHVGPKSGTATVAH